MSWGALVTALLGFAGKILDIFREKQIRQEGVRAQVVQDQKETIHDVQVANEARTYVERAAALEPDRLRDDDGFKRPN